MRACYFLKGELVVPLFDLEVVELLEVALRFECEPAFGLKLQFFSVSWNTVVGTKFR